MNSTDIRPTSDSLATKWDPHSGYVNGRLNLVSPAKREYAELLQRRKSPAESRLWKDLFSQRQCRGHKFRQKAVLFGYVADFWCARLRLIVEVGANSERETHLRGYGLEYLRLDGLTVLNDWPTALTIVHGEVDRLKEVSDGPNRA